MYMPKAGYRDKDEDKYYVFCRDHYEEVSKDVYYVIMQEVWREEKRQQRMWRCRGEGGFRCMKDCRECEFDRIGSGHNGSVVSLDQMLDEDDFEPKAEGCFEDSVIFWIVIGELVKELSEMVPDAERIVQMIKNDEMEKDVAEELGIAKTTLNYRKKKVLSFLKEHMTDFI